MARRLLGRLGLTPRDPAADAALLSAVFEFLEFSRVPGGRVPFDRFFFDAYGGEARAELACSGPFGRVYTSPEFGAVRQAWREYVPARPDRLADPYLSRPGPVSMILPVVESVWSAIDRADDWGPFEKAIEEVRDLGRFLGR